MGDGPLSYCADLHPAADLDDVVRHLDRYAEPIRRAVPLARLGLGLRLPPAVASGLAADRSARRRLRVELDARGLEVVTLNTGGHEPRWTDPARLRYSLDCATVLADLLPDRLAYGSLGTLPLGWRQPWSPADDAAAHAFIETLVATLRTIDTVHGRPVTLALEPAPGYVLDTVPDAVRWLAGRVDPRYVGVCVDTCALAVSFLDPGGVVSAVYRAGFTVQKIQAATALQVDDPRDPAARMVLAGLAADVPQPVRERQPNGTTRGADDLPYALAQLPGSGPWRVGRHLPLHVRPEAPLRATTGVLRATVQAVLAETGTLDFPQVELDVCPHAAGLTDAAALVAGVAADVACVAELLDELGLGTGDTAAVDESVPLAGHSLGGPMTRVGSAYVG
ncbi:sugar phosphate isomerase/epimerase [Cryptosporangium aurantiacum]|uniref:Xylose isomerase-like TIM barrel n=1 Tax=Cryptosporangium aurantiacum TaxID=134849 RepID=A0A1M7QB53_9ACTN|nr:sugar phosphate isomerase/epimerase [Cryptosporangium aurantiacum]SHN27998.1 Xylose isomerase-like TIM barrel [Cryptosporangium aurantiacum]